MKRITLLLAFLTLVVTSGYGQLFTENTCDNLGSNLYGPMYSVATANATSRTAVIYPSGNLTQVAQQELTAIYFERITATGTMGGTPNFKIYFKETSLTDFGASAINWASEIAGATLVFDGDPTTIVGADAGWKQFPLIAPFQYSGTQNLAVYYEYTNPGASSGITWRYSYTSPCVDTGNSNTTKYTNNTTGTLPTDPSSTNFRRPYIGFDFTVNCEAPSNVNVTNITTTGATITWTQSVDLPDDGYEYYISQSSDGPLPSTTPTGGVAAGSDQVVITDLNPGTTYYYWVRSVCDDTDPDEYSFWVGGNAFTTLCVPVEEFIETFEGYPTGNGNLPNCWDKAGTSNLVYITTGSVAPMSPPNRLYFSASGTTPTVAYAILPPVSNLAANTHRLKLTAYATSQNRELQVGYVTDASDMSTFMLIQTLNLPGTAASTATEFTVVPGALPANATNLVFRNDGTPTGVALMYIDDVKWEFNSPCAEPSDLTAGFATDTSVQLSWINNGPETEWEIEWGEGLFSLGDGTTQSVTTNPYTLSSLLPNTQYSYYVRAICDGGVESSWSGPFSFTTQCAPVTEFIEDFDSYPTGTSSMPDCWGRGGTGSVYITTGGALPGTPPNRFYMFASGTAGTVAYAVLPPVSNLQAASHRLRFKAYATLNDRTLAIGYYTNPNDVSTFQFIQEVTLPGTTAGTAQEFTIIPPALPAGVTNLGFKNEGYPGSTATMYIDDVKWEFNSPCTDPSDLSVTTTTDSSATLAWTSNSTETEWEIEYGAPGFALGTGTSIENITTNPYVLTGLDENTTYQYYLRANCTDFDSSWVGPFTFTTACQAVSEFFENFDSYPTGTSSLPDCWARLGTVTTAYVTSSSVAPMSPPNRFYFSASSNNEIYALLPPVTNLQANTHRLRFLAYSTQANRVMEIGYLTTESDFSTFQFVASIELPGTTAATAQEYIIEPGTLPAGINRLAFKNTFPGAASTIYIDDVYWEAIPQCDVPSDIQVSNITKVSADVTYVHTEAGETNAQIEYGQPGFTQGSGTTITTTAIPATISGLTPGTEYEFYIRNTCDDNSQSVWVGPFSFTTLCDFPEIVTTTPGERCGLGTVTLSATSNDQDAGFNWYASETGGAPIGTGASFITPEIDETTSFWVAAVGDEASFTNQARPAPAATTATTPANYGLLFTATSSFTINSVKVYLAGTTASNLTVQLTDAAGAVLESVQIATPAGNATNPVEFVVPLNFDVTPGDYRLVSPSSGPSMVRELTVGGFPYALGTVGEVTAGYISGSSQTYYYFYAWDITAACMSEREEVVATVTPADPITVNATESVICEGDETTISVTSTNTDYEYEWMPGNLIGASHIVTPSETTTYTVTATDSDNGCVIIDEITIVVNELPSELIIDADDTTVCQGTVVPLSVSGGLIQDVVMFEEDFNAATNSWTTVNNSTDGSGQGPAAAAWTLRPSGTTPAPSMSSPDNSQFYISNSDAQGSGGSTLTILTSPAINATNFTDATLSFQHFYRHIANSNGYVELSNDGDNWTEIANYNVTQGAATAFADANLTIPASFLNQPELYVRFRYVATYGWYWAIDNVSITGTATADVVWSPVADLYLDEEATVPYAGEITTTVYAMPNADVTYTATATSLQDCVITAEVEIEVLPTPDAPVTDEPMQQFCGSATLEDVMITGTDINWYTEASGGDLLDSDFEIPMGTTVFYASQTVGACESMDRLAIEVSLAPIPDAPTGDAIQTISVDDLDDATIADIDVEGDNVMWFETEEDAMAGENALSEDTILVSGATYYAVSIVDGCISDVFAVTVTVALSNDRFDDSQFSYYPNPVNSTLTVQYSNVLNDLTVMNMLGQEVLKQSINNSHGTIDMSQLAEGTYMVRVTSDSQVKYFKVIKR